MKLRLTTAAIIFIGSYFPLSLIFLVQDIDYKYASVKLHFDRFKIVDVSIRLKDPFTSLIIFILCLLCVIITLIALNAIKPQHSVAIKSSKHIPAEMISYSFPYIVALMAIDYADTGKFVGFLIFICWMFCVTWRSGQIILNPLLTVFGWRLYAVTYHYSGDRIEYDGEILSTTPILPGRDYTKSSIDDVLIVKSAYKPES